MWDKIVLGNPIGKRYSDHHAYYRTRAKTVYLLAILTAGILFMAFVLSKTVQ